MSKPAFFIRTLTVSLWLTLCGFQSPHQQWPQAKKPVKKPEATVQETPELATKRPLDLTLPFKSPDTDEPTFIEPREQEQKIIGELFAPKTKKTESSVGLKGGLISSPEPEAEKQKSVDGARIMINIKE